MKYPVRCKIVDVTGQEVFPDIMGRTPDESKPHIGKRGLAERIGGDVRITLDDGEILWGMNAGGNQKAHNNKEINEDT